MAHSIFTPIQGTTWEELAEWIDNEGGVAEFFSSEQVGLEEIIDPRLKTLVRDFSDAYDQLLDYLRSRNGVV